MTLDSCLRIGETIELGAFVFEAKSIKAFARAYDPQPFHVDEDAARNTVFGALCASGWHTASVWMKLNVAYGDGVDPTALGDGPAPEFGPSPGVSNLKWLKPVYAGQTIRFSRTALRHRPLASRPGWRVVTVMAEAFDPAGLKVLEFESAVLVKAE